MRVVLNLLVLSLALLSPTAAFAKAPPSSVEGPALAVGTRPIGTATTDMALPGRWMLSATGAGEVTRTVALRIWYPAATGSKGRAAIYRHSVTLRGQKVQVPPETGLAIAGAKALPGRFPTVILSHGYGGWNTHFSRLGEALASHGYVVVSISHGDESFTDPAGFFRSFGNVLLNRAQDQRDVINRVVAGAASGAGPFAQVDADRIGLLGYSMGGYGALASAGAPYDLDAKPYAAAPPALRAAALSPDPATAKIIKAVVLVAPWGGQPDNRAWRADAVASVTQPVLVIGGDHDDIVNFRDGISWIFGGLTGSDRRMLVYREARHNVLGNAVDLGAAADPESIGFLAEPVWRQDRLNSINQHFVTAFFDLTLKGDATRRAYLDVPTVNAGDGQWPVAFGAEDKGELAGEAQPGYWRGFPRRWALGLEMHHSAAGAAPIGNKAQ